VSDNANSQRRKGDRPNGELQNDPEVGTEVPPCGDPRAGHQEWWQEKYQHQVGIELDIRRSGDHRKADAAHNKSRGAGKLKPPCEDLKNDDHGHEQQYEFEA